MTPQIGEVERFQGGKGFVKVYLPFVFGHIFTCHTYYRYTSNHYPFIGKRLSDTVNSRFPYTPKQDKLNRVM